ncbi:replicative DNA helicase [Streptomyces sp. ND04-05B]|nr:replicative DNA helicase [Streptomyces sp. ND04-05B]MDX3064010.1 replicative DNA helicase [Streptomyces sp. ND04-05B]
MSIPHQTAEAHTQQDDDLWGGEPQPEERRTFERVPPGGGAEDLDAEQAVLGGMLLSRDAIEDVAASAKLQPRDFYRPAHETIYNAVLKLYAQGEPADPVTTAAELVKSGTLTKVGGAPYLHTLVRAVPTAANAEYYAEIVKENAGKRRLVEAGTKIAQLGYGGGSLAELQDEAGAELFKVADEHAEEDYALAGDSLEADLDAIEALGRNKGALAGVPTGFADLDALLSGLQEEQFIIVAGRPAMGKSTAALDFVRACSIEHNIPTAYFSLEMGRREINYRLLSATGSVALHHIRNGTMSEEDWAKLGRATPKVQSAPVYVDASPNLTLMDIRTKARRLVQRHAVKAILVDYIQLMHTGSSKAGETRQQDVSEISRGLKMLAKELHVPVIGLSQLNRGPESRTDKKPQTSDLRESGSLEQDADIVILLHREDAYDKYSSRAGEADFIVAKNRNGPTATITVAFQGHYSRFLDMNKT